MYDGAEVNPIDWKGIEYHFIVNPIWRQIFGCDIAGEVSALRSKVGDFKVGDRVWVIPLPP